MQENVKETNERKHELFFFMPRRVWQKVCSPYSLVWKIFLNIASSFLRLVSLCEVKTQVDMKRIIGELSIFSDPELATPHLVILFWLRLTPFWVRWLRRNVRLRIFSVYERDVMPS